jgi:hypothetical protein
MTIIVQEFALNLSTSLFKQGKHVDAERILREVLGVQKQALGTDHPDTLISALHLATSLSKQGKHVEAEQMLHAALASLQRVLGPAHPNTLWAARLLQHVQALIRATPPTNTAAPAAAGAARPLPDGTRVLVQRLIAKPEHNGKRARVVSFDARTGRYAVSLDDGKELSLKAECVARAGCAAAGCASEEASSVCGRCEAVRYCSRQPCRRACVPAVSKSARASRVKERACQPCQRARVPAVLKSVHASRVKERAYSNVRPILHISFKSFQCPLELGLTLLLSTHV